MSLIRFSVLMLVACRQTPVTDVRISLLSPQSVERPTLTELIVSVTDDTGAVVQKNSYGATGGVAPTLVRLPPDASLHMAVEGYSESAELVGFGRTSFTMT